MKLASADLIVWAIIAIVVAVAKGIGKLTGSADDTTESDDTPVSPPPIARPRPVARPAAPRPVMRRVAPPQTVPAQIREMMDRLAEPKRPVVPPPVAPPVAPPPKADPAPKPAPAAEPVAARPDRNTQWATALRDRSNVRNIIIAAEIIGPPKGA